jgi:hypothetical protein
VFRQHLFGMGSALPEYLRALLPAPQERMDGSLVVWGYASRGECIYTYPSNEGVVRVYRPGSVVFDPASLESFRGAPVTHGHPPEADGYMVTPATWRAQAHGSVLESGRGWYEHGLIAVPLTLQTQEIIDAFRAGRVALSTGELCIETPLSGQIDGQGYDRVLEAMLINHLALVDVGRAGPLAQIRAHQLPTLQPPTQRPERHMEYVKIVINGHEFWVPKNEQEAERARIERAFTERHNAALAPIQAERDRLQARADEQAAQIEQLRARPAEEELTARVNQAAAATIQERVEAMTRVLPLFGGGDHHQPPERGRAGHPGQPPVAPARGAAARGHQDPQAQRAVGGQGAGLPGGVHRGAPGALHRQRRQHPAPGPRQRLRAPQRRAGRTGRASERAGQGAG